MAASTMESVRSFGSKTWSSIRIAVGAEEEEDEGEQTLLGQINEATTLSRMQRLYGFGICLGIGIFFSLISNLFILSPKRFGVCYTFGNLMSIGSMMFLMGPWNQVKGMFKKARWIATLIYLASMVATLYVAIGLKSTLLALVFVIIQFCALVWYSLSYIPYAREVVMSVITRCFGDK